MEEAWGALPGEQDRALSPSMSTIQLRTRYYKTNRLEYNFQAWKPNKTMVAWVIHPTLRVQGCDDPIGSPQ